MKAIRDKLRNLNNEKLARVYQNLFNTEEGQLVLEDLKKQSHWDLPQPEGEPGQRMEGRRQLIIYIKTMLNFEEVMENVKRIQEAAETEET